MRDTSTTADLSIALDTTLPSSTCLAVTATGARREDVEGAVFTETRAPMTEPAEKAREAIVRAGGAGDEARAEVPTRGVSDASRGKRKATSSGLSVLRARRVNPRFWVRGR